MSKKPKTKKEPTSRTSGKANRGNFPSTDVFSLLINNYLQKSEFQTFTGLVPKKEDLDNLIGSSIAKHEEEKHKPFVEKVKKWQYVVGVVVAVLIFFGVKPFISDLAQRGLTSYFNDKVLESIGCRGKKIEISTPSGNISCI